MMSRRAMLLGAACLALGPLRAWAGMPQSGTALTDPLADVGMTDLLTDGSRRRLQNISFFLAGFCLASLLIQRLWNALRRDVPKLPRLSYLRAMGVVGLWGLLFVLVLTMISGARELMTPGAWRPSGATYRLTDEAAEEALNLERRERIGRLKEALWAYARDNGGRFPASRQDSALAEGLWQPPDAPGMVYAYRAAEPGQRDAPLAFEPDVYRGPRWVVFADGETRQVSNEELARLLAARAK